MVAGLILGTEELSAAWIPKWNARRPMDFLATATQTLLTRDDISGRLGEITCPVLVIHGTEDQAIPMEMATAVAEGVADCRGFVEVSGAAHAPNLKSPRHCERRDRRAPSWPLSWASLVIRLYVMLLVGSSTRILCPECVRGA